MTQNNKAPTSYDLTQSGGGPQTKADITPIDLTTDFYKTTKQTITYNTPYPAGDTVCFASSTGYPTSNGGYPTVETSVDSLDETGFVTKINLNRTNRVAVQGFLEFFSPPSYSKGLLVNGNPAFAFFNPSPDEIQWFRALDADGLTWPALPTIVPLAAFNNYQHIEIAIIDGNPALCCYNATTNRCHYIRSLDANGDTWPATDNDFAMGVVNISNFSMKFINGFPMIAYKSGTTQHMKLARGSDVAGSSWAVQTVATGHTGFGDCGLIDVSGVPAVAWPRQNTPGEPAFNYALSNNGLGSSWPTPTVINTVETATSISDCDLVMVNGLPAITGVFNGNKLGYVRATSTTAWANPMPTIVNRSSLSTPRIVVIGGLVGVYFGASGSPSVWPEPGAFYIKGLDNIDFPVFPASGVAGNNNDIPLLTSHGFSGNLDIFPLTNGKAFQTGSRNSSLTEPWLGPGNFGFEVVRPEGTPDLSFMSSAVSNP